MALPDTSLTVSGGCNCRAIRYRINIPALAERPIHPWSNNSVQLPFIVVCHCNDCRAATGALTLAGVCNAIDFVTVSLLPRSSTLLPLQAKRVESEIDDAERIWVQASEVFAPSTPPVDSFRPSYQTSEGVTRTFCARCGTNLTYTRWPVPPGWPDIMDVLLGTVDRGDLETDTLAAERHVWWAKGIGWIQDLFTGVNGALPKHASAKLTETVD